jgi:hypothetical protein
MNYLTIVNNVLERCHDPDKREFVEANVNYHYQQLMADFDWPFLKKRGTITTSAGTAITDAEYELASDCRFDGLIRFWNMADGKALSFEEHGNLVEQYPDMDDTGSPSYVIPFGLGSNGYPIVILYPIPDGVYTIYYQYLMRVDDLSADDDEPIFPSEFHYYLEERALADAYEHEDDTLYQTALQKAEYIKSRMKKRFSTAYRGQTFSFKEAADVGIRRRRRIY